MFELASNTWWYFNSMLSAIFFGGGVIEESPFMVKFKACCVVKYYLWKLELPSNFLYKFSLTIFNKTAYILLQIYLMMAK
jgi:hypothetical protein